MRKQFSLILGLATVLVTVGASCSTATNTNTTETTNTNTTTVNNTNSGTTNSSGGAVNTSVTINANTAPTEEDAATTGTISISGFAFSPTTLTVAPGATITVTNNDSAPHSVTANDNSFDTGLLAKGKSATFTAPSTPGTYLYFCTAHPSMTGTLIVQ